jgi:hypothetical protein
MHEIKGRELSMGGTETKRSLLQTASLHFGKGIEEEPWEGFSYNAELIQTYCFAVPCLKHCLILCTPVQFKQNANTDLQSTRNWNLSPSPFKQLEPSSSLYTIIKTERFCSRSCDIKVF